MPTVAFPAGDHPPSIPTMRYPQLQLRLAPKQQITLRPNTQVRALGRESQRTGLSSAGGVIEYADGRLSSLGSPTIATYHTMSLHPAPAGA